MRIEDVDLQRLEIKWYLGYSYYLPERLESIFYPIPFNFIVRWLRSSLWFLRSYLWKKDKELRRRDGSVYDWDRDQYYYNLGREEAKSLMNK